MGAPPLFEGALKMTYAPVVAGYAMSAVGATATPVPEPVPLPELDPDAESEREASTEPASLLIPEPFPASV
jgi:hypothetical protein